MITEAARFCDWLSSTSISMTFQPVRWTIPMVRSVHILAIAAVMSSAILVDLRLLALAGIDMLAFRAAAYRSVRLCDNDHPAPPAARAAGVLPFAGRIGFTVR